jgi:tetratricopeptide (TPR) repeat protein
MLKAIGNWWTQALLENVAGWMYAHLGQQQQAMAHCQRALGLHREAGSRIGQGDTLVSIGYIYTQLGDFAQARSFYRQALDIFQEIGLPLGEAEALTGLGEALAAEGDVMGARDAWTAAEQILRQLAHPDANEIRAKLAALDNRPGTTATTAVSTGR